MTVCWAPCRCPFGGDYVPAHHAVHAHQRRLQSGGQRLCGQYSDEAFLALSYAYPIQMLLVAFCSGIGVGFSAIFSRRLGEGDQEQAASAVCHGFFLYGLCWLLFLLFALTGAAPFLRLSTEDPSVAGRGPSTC